MAVSDGALSHSLINRYYDPSTAQFLTIDPLVDATGQPYQYASDDPVNGSDPSGLWGGNPISDAEQAWNDTGGKVVHAAATHTIGVCLNGAVGVPGLYLTASGCVGLVGGVPRVLGSAGVGATTTPTASITGGLLFSNAHSGNQLSGWFGMAGGSANIGPFSVGDDFHYGTDSCGNSIWEDQPQVGLAARFPFVVGAEGHAAATYTWVGP